jgi:hypothetical protein
MTGYKKFVFQTGDSATVATFERKQTNSSRCDEKNVATSKNSHATLSYNPGLPAPKCRKAVAASKNGPATVQEAQSVDIAGFKKSVAEVASVALSPSPNEDFVGHPAPQIMKETPFGSDGVPTRYLAAWQALLSQCPVVGVRVIEWEMAIYDSAALFAIWGAELDRLHWTPGDLFDVPHDGKQGGLAWFLRGEHVLALGPKRAFTETGRIFDRTQMALVEPVEAHGETDYRT